MTVQWEKVYVFISSTFNDMHGERDYLVKQVFPRLQEWCERRKLRLVDVDLRWGVTEADATQNRRVVQVCLERIDACRPFFLCFLGQRRGWVPDRSDISPETYSDYPELARYAGDASVTELEILHALVNPLHRGKVTEAGGAREYTPTEHSFFYLRGDMYLGLLRGEVPLLREIYTNEGIADAGVRGRADVELGRWRAREIPATGRPVHAYAARWNPEASTPEIRLPLECPSTAVRGSPAWQAAQGRWSSQWDQAGVRVDPDGQIGDPAERRKAERFNARLSQGRLGGFTCEGRPLVDTILEDLQAAIQARYPEHAEAVVLTPLQRELDQQAQFIQAAGEGFIERQGDFSALDGYLRDESARSFFLAAQGGLGKTSLLARWIDRCQAGLEPGESVHYRFIGASDGSTTVDALLRSLLVELKEVAGKLEEEIPAGPEKLRAALPGLLSAAGKRGKTVLVLDGLNQLETGMGDLAWLPLVLPPGIKLVVSFKRGEPHAETYFETLRSGGQARLAEVMPFESMEDRRRLVRAYLSQYLKELDERHIEALVHSEGASNPLYLKVVLAELRVFGAFADLGAKIREDFGATPVSAFAGLLRRLESDPAYSPVRPELLVPRLFAWLAHSRTGLTVEELGGLLVQEELLLDDEAGRQRATEAVHGLLRQVRPYLSRREGRSDFFYESFKLAVLERYAAVAGQAGVHPESRAAKAWHASLAGYFDAQPLRLGADQVTNRRKLAELAYQLAHAGMAEPLCRTLWDYAYLQTRLEIDGIEALISDYDLANLAESGLEPEARRTLALLQQALRLSAHVLSRDARLLPSQLTGRLLGFEQEDIHGLLEAARRETRGPWLRPLSPSLDGPGGALVRTLSCATGTDAVALTPDGRLAVSASHRTLTVWDLTSGSALRSVRAFDVTAEVQALALTPDGRVAVAASRDGTVKALDVASGSILRTVPAPTPGRRTALSVDGRLAVGLDYGGTLTVWDVISGLVLQKLAGHPEGSDHVALTPDGRRAISAASRGGTLKVWDVARGTELHTLTGHGEWGITALAIAPDGRLAVSASTDRTLKVWDLASGRELRALDGVHGQLALTPDGRLVVAASGKTLRIWDVASGAELCSLVGHVAPVTAVALTPGGRFALSGCSDRDYTLKLWDIQAAIRTGSASAMDAAPRHGHADEVKAVALTPDGHLAISASWDGTLKVWDAATGKELYTLAGHTGGIYAVALTPDGRLAVSAANDRTLKVWDLASGAERYTLAGPPDEPEYDTARAVVVTPDGLRAVARLRNSLREWDLASGQELRALEGYPGNVSSLAQAIDGRLVISSATGDPPIVWDMVGGRMLHRLTPAGKSPRVEALTPDGRVAVTSSWEVRLRHRERRRSVWDVASAKELLRQIGDSESSKVYKPEVMLSTTGGKELLVQLGQSFEVLTPDGRLALEARADGTLKVWDAETRKEIVTPAAFPIALCAFTPDERLAVSAEASALKVWDISAAPGAGQPSWVEMRTMSGHTSWVNCLALTPDGRFSVSASEDQTLMVWDVANGTELRRLSGHRENITSVALTSDGRRAVSASFDGVLKAWDTKTGKALHTLTAHSGPVNAVALTALGSMAVTASVDRTLKVWLVSSGMELRTLVGHAGQVNAVALTPNGRVAVSASDDRTLKVWDTTGGKPLRTLVGHADRVNAVALTADGRLAISASEDHTLKVWDVAAGTELRTLAGHAGPLTGVALTADGCLAVSASVDKTLRLWDVTAGKELLALTGLSDRASAVAVDANGRLVVWASMDNKIRVWGVQAAQVSSTSSPSVFAAFVADGDVAEQMAVTSDARCFIAGDKGGHVHFLRLEGVTPGRAVVTAWRAPDGPAALGCPHCRTWSEIPESALGAELPCPQCGQVVRLNPFVVEADWRPVAKAWRGTG